jgi:Methyltransferase domain
MQSTSRDENFGDFDPRFDLGPYVDEHYVLLQHVLRWYRRPETIALEFGVGSGNSIRQIARHMPVIGFDSFKGLPEDWRDGYPAGAFACEPPIVPSNVHLVVGMFEDTLPDFSWGSGRRNNIGLVHIDCDLYSSTATVLKHIGPLLRRGCVIVFDEWHGYEGCEEHEQRAWREFVADHSIKWQVLGHSFQQWGIRVI